MFVADQLEFLVSVSKPSLYYFSLMKFTNTFPCYEIVDFTVYIIGNNHGAILILFCGTVVDLVVVNE